MSDETSTPAICPIDAAPEAPSPVGPGSTDSLAAAFEMVRDAHPIDTDTLDVPVDDSGSASLAEETGAGSRKP